MPVSAKAGEKEMRKIRRFREGRVCFCGKIFFLKSCGRIRLYCSDLCKKRAAIKNLVSIGYFGYCVDCKEPLRDYDCSRCRMCDGKSRIGKKMPHGFGAKIALKKLSGLNPMWKGDKVGYTALHNWVRRRLAYQGFCQDCGDIPKNCRVLDLANISGEYKRDLRDWEWLCRSCHMTKDGRMKNLNRRNKK